MTPKQVFTMLNRPIIALVIAAVLLCALVPYPARATLDVAPLPGLPWPGASILSRADAMEPSPLIAGMMEQVQSTALYSLTGELTGEWPALVGGAPYTISTRHTDSGVPIQKATQFAYERLAGAGLTVTYHDWYTNSHGNRNVAAVMTGTIHPDEIVLAVAHLDSICFDQPGRPCNGHAPGADDNASGSAAVLTMAGILSRHRFDRTIRFVLFTGEEQGLHGSKVYAAEALASGDNIVAVFNMDMIGWNTPGSEPGLDLFIRTPAANPGDLAIAGTFTNVVQAYGLAGDLQPEVIVDDDMRYSDHWYFWQHSYPAILAIEDYIAGASSDFNPYYHSISDTLHALDLPYFTAFVKASLATVAHLAQPARVVYLAHVQRP